MRRKFKFSMKERLPPELLEKSHRNHQDKHGWHFHEQSHQLANNLLLRKRGADFQSIQLFVTQEGSRFSEHTAYCYTRRKQV
jgi:hypothetical protein